MSALARRRAFMDTLELKAIDAEQLLPRWTRPTIGARVCFGEKWETIAQARPNTAGPLTIVFLSFENPKAVGGGILAVMKKLPTELHRHGQRTSRESGSAPDLIRLSPHHTSLRTQYASDELKFVVDCNVHFDGKGVKVTVHEFTSGDKERWYLFGADGFFTADGDVGGTDPYTYSGEIQSKRDGDDSLLLRDSLFASKAVPVILAALRRRRNLIVHAQDWEFASAALTIKEAILDGTVESAVVVLTLHNPYDQRLSQSNLKKITDRSDESYWPAIGWMGRSTVLTRMIPLLDAPASVVSHRFAWELTEAPIQTGVFAGHLQGVLDYQGLVGIDNGDFGPEGATPFSAEAVASARQGDATKILGEKAEKRATMLRALSEYLKVVVRDNPEMLTLGNLTSRNGESLEKLPDTIPLFMMIGRLDPGQKGYDVCAATIRSLPPGAARFVLTPMSPLANEATVSPFFDQLKRLAEKERPGEVVVFAHRMTRAYKETMAGATYGLWPSRYEPFGGVSEFYACGTPVIAHAVGGLLQQVVGYEEGCNDSTGLLYNSHLATRTKAALKREYRQAHDEREPAQRLRVSVYQHECEGLQRAILQASDLFQNSPKVYGTMLANLPEILQELGWGKPVQDYLQWYATACHAPSAAQ